MGCLEDFIEFREAMESIKKEWRKEPDPTARDEGPRQFKRRQIDADQPMGLDAIIES